MHQTRQPEDYYALTRWLQLAQGEEVLLIRILADTAGLKGWLSRPLYERLSEADLQDVITLGLLDNLDRAAVYLLSQMPQFNGPEQDSEWMQWLKQWQQIHKDRSAAEQLDLLPERFDSRQAEMAMKALLNQQHEHGIPILQSI